MLKMILVLFAASLVSLAASGADFQFRDQELPTRLTVGYAVRLLDMNERASNGTTRFEKHPIQ